MKKNKKIVLSLFMIILMLIFKLPVFAATTVTGSGAFFNFQDPTLFNSAGHPAGYAPDGSLGVLDVTGLSNGNINYDINVYDDGNSAGTPDPNYSVTNLSKTSLSLDLADTGGFPPLVPGYYYAQNYQIRNNSSSPITFNFQGGIAIGDLQTELDQWLWTYGADSSLLTSFTLNPGESTPVFAAVFGMTPASSAQSITGNLAWVWNFSTASSTFTVDFDSQGGSAVPSQEVESSQPYITEPEAPTKEGYTFTGWFTDSTLATAFDFSQEISSNLTLYAGWEQEAPTTWTVTFDSQGGSAVSPQVLEDQALLSRPSDPQKAGYIFKGWYKDIVGTSPFNFQQAVNSHLTLYAVWEKVMSPQPSEPEPPLTENPTPNEKHEQAPETGASATTDPTLSLPTVGDESGLNLKSLGAGILILSSLIFLGSFRKKKRK